jgi:hypothetical protein
MSRASISSVTIGRPVRCLASASRRVGGVERLVARLDRAGAGDQGEVIAADPAAADLQDGAHAVLELGRGQLVGLEDRDDLLHALVAFEAEALHVLAVADGADDRHLLPAAGVRGCTDGLDARDHGLNLLFGGRGLHDDHHWRGSFSGLG